MPDLDMMNGRPNVYSNNTGLAEAVGEGDLWAKDASQDAIDEYIAGLLASDPDYAPAYVLTDDGSGTGTMILKIQFSISAAASQAPTCLTRSTSPAASGGSAVTLPGGVWIENVVIVGDCKITGTSVWLRNVVLASSFTANGQDPYPQNGIHFASDAQIGSGDFCSVGGGEGQVTMITKASMHVAAGPDVYGLRMIAGGDIEFTANNSVFSVSAQAGNNITATSNGDWSYCVGGDFAGPFEWHYALVQ